MNKFVRFGLPVVAVVAGVGYGVSRLNAPPENAVKVGRVVTVKIGDVTLKVSENGTLEPVRRVDVKSRVPGRVQKIMVREGDIVRAGATLAVVDPIEIVRDVAGVQARLAAARATLRQAEENYALTQRQNALSIRRAEAALNESRMRLRQTSAPNRIQDVDSGRQNLVRAGQVVARSRQAVVRTQQNVITAQQNIVRAKAQVANTELTLGRRKALVVKGFTAQSDADQAELQVAVARADLETAKSSLQSALADVQGAKSDVQAAISDERAARERVSLLKEGAQREVIDTARAGVQTAEVGLETEKANAAQVSLRFRDVERTRAEIAQIENQLAQQNVLLNETRIFAPISGEVISRTIEEGELIASATAGFAAGAIIASIADLSRMQVRVNINEVDVARVRVGQAVEVRVDGVPGKVFLGKVSSIAPASIGENNKPAGQSTTTTGVVRFPVKVSVPNANKILRPGMTAAIKIITAKRTGVVAVLSDAIQPGGKVTVVTGAGKTLAKAERKVDIGLKSETLAEIKSGLQPGDRLEIPTLDAKDRRKINIGPPEDGGD